MTVVPLTKKISIIRKPIGKRHYSTLRFGRYAERMCRSFPARARHNPQELTKREASQPKQKVSKTVNFLISIIIL